MFDIFCALIGICFGILFVWTFNTPRLLQYPEEESLQLKYSYGVDCVNEHNFNINKTFPSRMYWWIRWKYWLEIFAIQWIPGRAFLSVPDNSGDTTSESYFLIREVFRSDWFVYLVIQVGMIWMVWAVNWTTYLEQEVFWRKDLKFYTSFHIAWTGVFLLFMIAAVYMFVFPKMLVTFSSVIVFVFLICALIIVRCPLPCFRRGTRTVPDACEKDENNKQV